MYTIGGFATLGRVSVRMLRHYDIIGLLVPARVEDRIPYCLRAILVWRWRPRREDADS
jgi:hypothetical protein